MYIAILFVYLVITLVIIDGIHFHHFKPLSESPISILFSEYKNHRLTGIKQKLKETTEKNQKNIFFNGSIF